LAFISGCQTPQKLEKIEDKKLGLRAFSGQARVLDKRQSGGKTVQISLQVHTWTPSSAQTKPRFRIDAFGPLGIVVGFVALDGDQVTWLNAREKRAGKIDSSSQGLGGILPADVRSQDIYQLLVGGVLAGARWRCELTGAIEICNGLSSAQFLRREIRKDAQREIEIKTKTGDIDLLLQEDEPKVQVSDKMFSPEIPKGWQN
jgi:hypothetical protein